MRRPAPGAFSIERVFADIRAALPEGIEVRAHRNAHLSRGIVPRLRDAWTARRAQAQVNHVVGDVHYVTFFLSRRRTVLTIHDTIFIERAHGLKRAFLWLFWLWLPVHRAQHLVAISEESKSRILRLVSVDAARVSVIPNPVAPSFERQPEGARAGPFRVLHIGTKPNKNLERLVRALGPLEVELTVIGVLSEAQRRLIAQHVPRHRLLDMLDDARIRAEYARCEALLFVSLDEGFGLPILEAQATGRPVLTSDRAPMRDVAGQGALCVDPADEAAIRDAVSRLIRDAALREDLIRKGADNVALYSAEAVAARYADLYRQVAQATGND